MSLVRTLPLAAAAALLAAPLSAQKLILTAQPAQASIYRLKAQDNSLVLLGTGRAEFKLEKNDPNTVVVRLDGYRDVRRTFPREQKYPDKNFTLFLSKRVVKITAQPYDASIVVNGEPRGQRSLELEVDEGQPTTVEVKKRGFNTLRRTYRFERNGEMPPMAERLDLVDRLVTVTTTPTGAEILREGTKIGDGSADVVVPAGACVAVVAQKTGFVAAEANYCNKENVAAPPFEDRLQLKGRAVVVSAAPEARILVNDKVAGSGTFTVRVNEGSCANVRVERDGFIPYVREYCAQPNAPEPPLEDPVSLEPDESFDASVQNEQANINITLEAGKTKTEEQAWKLVSSIILGSFDILENSDSETGYLRTAWQMKPYAGGRVLIRTRVILKRSSSDPVRYTIKLVSERNRVPGMTSKDDENFVPWDRVLKTYSDLVPELQSRIK